MSLSKSSFFNVFRGSQKSSNGEVKSLPSIEAPLLPTSGSFGGVIRPSAGYVPPPPLPSTNRPLDLSSQETKSDIGLARVSDHYTPIGRLDSVVDQLNKATTTIREQREKILMLERDLSKAQHDRDKAILAASALKVSH